MKNPTVAVNEIGEITQINGFTWLGTPAELVSFIGKSLAGLPFTIVSHKEGTIADCGRPEQIAAFLSEDAEVDCRFTGRKRN